MLAEPIAVVVDIVADVESVLERARIEAVVIGVAGGRAKRRRLAQALVERPSVLSDGLSPAARTVGDLLIALRAAGAADICAPVCAGCAKALRTLQRRGQDWYCGACGPRREPCAACGKVKPVHCRDRAGQPLCDKCPLQDGGDPVDVVVDLVCAIDPMLTEQVVTEAVKAAATQSGQRHQLAWALAERPQLLTGDGAQAPVPSVLRLIDRLCDAGSTRILRPPCPHCGRVIALVKPRNGIRLCRNCVARSRAEPCSRCGAVREAATRDNHGKPLCPTCLITDPTNQEICVGCQRRRPVSSRTPEGPLCPTCQPIKIMTCSHCGRQAPCHISKTTNQPWCQACKQRWARCSGCGQERQIRGGTLEEPLCATCAHPDASFWRTCPGCGQTGRIHTGRCARCTMQQRLREVFSDSNGQIHPELDALYQSLATTQRTATVAAWLDKSDAPHILRDLPTGKPITHATLDDLPAGKPLEHLRAVLVAIGTLPPRDEQMVRLERWITATVAARHDPDQQQLLHRYAVWHQLRRLRQRTNGAQTTHNQLVGVRQHVRAAITLLDMLTAHDLTLSTCRQGDLDTWITSDQASFRREIGNFVRWANKQNLTSLELPATRWTGPTRTIDTEARWDQARRLLHDDTLKPEDRVAGLLVLLYAQWPAAISRLTLSHVETDDNTVQLSLGREPVILPEPLAGLVQQLITNRRGHANLGDHGTSPWLFPGGQPGRPISAFQLTERLRQLGLHPGPARSTALFHLATELPAAILARMLGIHISVAVAWQRASAGDWATYAADVSRRTNQ